MVSYYYIGSKQVIIIENACSSLMKKTNYLLSSDMDSKVN